MASVCSRIQEREEEEGGRLREREKGEVEGKHLLRRKKESAIKESFQTRRGGLHLIQKGEGEGRRDSELQTQSPVSQDHPLSRGGDRGGRVRAARLNHDDGGQEWSGDRHGGRGNHKDKEVQGGGVDKKEEEEEEENDSFRKIPSLSFLGEAP